MELCWWCCSQSPDANYIQAFVIIPINALVSPSVRLHFYIRKHNLYFPSHRHTHAAFPTLSEVIFRRALLMFSALTRTSPETSIRTRWSVFWKTTAALMWYRTAPPCDRITCSSLGRHSLNPGVVRYTGQSYLSTLLFAVWCKCSQRSSDSSVSALNLIYALM